MVSKECWIATVVSCAALTSCVFPYPYWETERLEKEYVTGLPPELRGSDVRILALQQRARLIDLEKHESTEQTIEAPRFARGRDVERIVTGTNVARIQGVGLGVAMPMAGAGGAPLAGSGSRLKALAIITQDGAVYCTTGPIEHYVSGHLFRSYTLSAASKETTVAALQSASGDVTLPLVQDECQLSGTFSWSDAERKQVIEFLQAIPVEPAPAEAQPTPPPSLPSQEEAK